MNNTMIIDFDNGTKQHFICASYRCKQIQPSENNIPVFHSHKETGKEGWIHTRDPKYCPPGEVIVAVCPSCSEGETWEQ